MDKQKNTSSNRTGAYILIGIGVVLLLNSVLNINLIRLWPLLLVGVGLYLLLGRDKIASAAQTGQFSAPVDGARSADYDIHLSVGEVTIDSLPDGDRLIDADLSYVGDIEFDVSGAEHKRVRLRQTVESGWQWLNPANWFGGSEHYQWHIGLHPDIPAQLAIRGGVGTADLRLRDLTVTDLNLRGGVGEITGTLPASDEGYDAHIQGGVGKLHLGLPASIKLDIQGGVGEITLDTDASAAIRLEASGGLGDVHVPSHLKKLSGDPGPFFSGLWETDGFADAEHRITVNYRGGMGTLRLR